MQISRFDLQNFRKLQCCSIELDKQQTLFVGANNSGKTSAMDALILFLKRPSKRRITTTDFTLSNWEKINEIGNQWVSGSINEEIKTDLSRELWEPLLPTLDTWISVGEDKIHHVSHLLPSLDWNSGKLGVRLIFEPEKIEDLYKRFITNYKKAKDTIASRAATSENETKFSLWPKNMRDFLDRELGKHFKINAYILDPAREHEAQPQQLPPDAIPLDGDPFSGLFKIDIINAQRGFSDPNSDEDDSTHDRKLSSQFRKYFDKHLNPEDMPDVNDIGALESISTARKEFDKKLKDSFQPALAELEGLNYPGFSNPSILLSSNVKPLDSLNHDSAVQFSVNRPTEGSALPPLSLPEKYNGLGYQNLISMVFKLIRFRDEWMRVKKANKVETGSQDKIEVLHLVLIEEPEAHLHAQVQQVFMRKAYDVLRNHPDLKNNVRFATQMVVSTHSSHIAHEIDFTCLRYFRRKPAPSVNEVPCSTVANLSKVFGDESKTAQFAKRYLKTTHCDLFFADATILVEGPAEKILVPHFIRSHFKELDKSYLTILEIGGSHAHRLRPLVEKLELIALVITDLDPIAENSLQKVIPEFGKGLRTRNSTIKGWAPKKEKLDEALNASGTNKISADGKVRVAYQCPVSINSGNDKPTEAIPYTFEDSLVLANIEFFKAQIDACGLLGNLAEASRKATIKDICKNMFDALKNGNKAEMALDLLYIKDPETLRPPQYIYEGLEWLQSQLGLNRNEFPEPSNEGESHD